MNAIEGQAESWDDSYNLLLQNLEKERQNKKQMIKNKTENKGLGQKNGLFMEEEYTASLSMLLVKDFSNISKRTMTFLRLNFHMKMKTMCISSQNEEARYLKIKKKESFWLKNESFCLKIKPYVTMFECMTSLI